MSRNPVTSVRASEIFLREWFVRQEHFLQELRSTLQNHHLFKDEDLRDLITRVFAHYQQYYEEKSRVANQDVLLVFDAPWVFPLERTFFWIGGVKPGLAFRIVRSWVEDMSEEQTERMERLKAEMRAEEKELGDELARIQEGVAVPPVVRVARRLAVEEDCGEVGSAIDTLRAELEVVVGNADLLRTRTVERVAEILTPVQNVRFLTALTEVLLKIRMWGSELSR